MGRLEGVYHFALLHVEATDSSQTVKKRGGNSKIGERVDKTTQLTAEENVRILAMIMNHNLEPLNVDTFGTHRKCPD